jgi:serine/threonine-protein kinase
MPVILRVTAGPHCGEHYVFNRHETFVVGRSSQAAFSVPDDGFMSRNHFLIEFNPPACYLRDLGSTNGTKVNGIRVESARLREGDAITAGESAFVVHVEQSGSGEFRVIECMRCGKPAPSDTAVAAHPDDTTVEWLCSECAEQRRKYPNPPPGFWIENRIGGGGMGEVFLARHLASGRPVAIKMMIPTVAASERAKAYFRRELDIVRSLRHPNIISFYHMVEIEGQFQLIMEYFEGKNALKWTAALPTLLDYRSAARIGVQLLSALDHAHGKGYVHRDIKPSNLLVKGEAGDPIVKLSDFGLAKSFRDNAGFAGLTHQGDIGGSIGFISPDHIRDFRDVKEPADLYSVGATLYYMLTGHYPFLDFDPNRPDAYTMILEHPPIPLRARRSDAPGGLERVLAKALEKQAKDRYQSATAMAAALSTFCLS